MSPSTPPESPASRARAQSPAMIRCYHNGSDNNYRFELQERIWIDYPPRKTPTCSACPATQGPACKHVMYVDRCVLDAEEQLDGDVGDETPISLNGAAYMESGTTNGIFFHDLLRRRGLDEIADQKDWWLQVPGDINDNSKIAQRTAEIFSVFEPSSFTVDHDDKDRQRASQEVLECFRNTLIKILTEQPQWLFDLQSAVPLEKRRDVLICRAQDRIDEAFMKSGPGKQESDVLDASSIIRIEVRLLSKFVLANQMKLQIGVQQHIAGILLKVLEQVTQRDMDADHKLFEQLAYEHKLILETLEELGAQILYEPGLTSRMRDLAQTLASQGAPQGYLTALMEVMDFED